MGNKNFIKESIALGKNPYCDKIHLKGRNGAITSTAETIYAPSDVYAQLLTGVAMEVVSSSGNDAAAGTGARTVQVDWIDTNYVAGSEVITLNGVTPVPLVKTSVLAINGFKVLTVGSGLVNAGTVSVRTVSGSVVKSSIAGVGYSNSAHSFLYTIPDNFIGLLGSVSYSATGVTGDLTVLLKTSDSNGLYRTEAVGKSSLYVTAFNGAQGTIDLGSGLLIPEKTLIELQALNSAGAGDLVAHAELLLFDVKNNGLF